MSSGLKGATANELPNPVSDVVKQQRWDAFMERQQSISATKLAKKIGTTQAVLIDAVEGDRAVGRGMADAPEIDGVVHLTAPPGLKPGDLVEGEVSAADDYDLWMT